MAAPEWTSRALPQRFQVKMRRRLALRGGLRDRGVHADVPITALDVDNLVLSARPLRVLVLFADGGGASTEIAACAAYEGAEIIAVELSDIAAAVYAANHPQHQLLQLDLADTRAAAARLIALCPFDLVQCPPPPASTSRAAAGASRGQPLN